MPVLTNGLARVRSNMAAVGERIQHSLFAAHLRRRRTQFGLLSYSTPNLGDFIQSLAARKFLPRVDFHIDREALDECTGKAGPTKLIMNGWFCHRPDKWPPSPEIEPLLTSVHITDNPEPGSGVRARREFSRMPQVLDYLRRHGPVGARDHFTLEWLQSHDIDCYFSGCLTLTLDRPAVRREEFVLLNDLPDELAERAKASTKRPTRTVSNVDEITIGADARLARAAALIEEYARAACVVTTRLHCALPCLAIGTPVLLIDASWDRSRFTGLYELMHHCSVGEFMSGAIDYDFDDPPSNPDRHLPLRAALEERTSAFLGARRRVQ